MGVKICWYTKFVGGQHFWVVKKVWGATFVGGQNFVGVTKFVGVEPKRKLFRLDSFETINLGELFNLTRLSQKSFFKKSAQDQPELNQSEL